MQRNRQVADRNRLYGKLAPFALLTAVLLWGYSYIVTKSVLSRTSPQVFISIAYPVSYTHLTLPTIYSV